MTGTEWPEGCAFPRTEIYRWDADPPVKHLTVFDRFKVG